MDDSFDFDDPLTAFATYHVLEHIVDEDSKRERDAGVTPLMVAAANGSVREVENLIAQGVDVNAQNRLGATALMYAIYYSGSVDVARILVENGADVNTKDVYGLTALMHAAYSGKEDLVVLLMENGADVHLKDNEGKMAVNYAAERGYTRIVELLRIAGWRQYPPDHLISALRDIARGERRDAGCRSVSKTRGEKNEQAGKNRKQEKCTGGGSI